MNLFATIIEALHRSRQRHADEVIRRYAHLVAQAHQHERRRRLEAADVPAVVPPMHLTSAARCAS